MGEGELPVHMTSKINSLEQYFTQAHIITAPDVEDKLGQHKVTFGANPAKPTYILQTTLQSALAHVTKN
jgi:hypothetical protein